MKNRNVFFTLLFTGLIILLSGSGNPKQDQYIIIGWNDLGMHCSNKDFSKIVILPPYNNLFTHVIKRGTLTSMPEKITEGLTVTYEVPGNTFSVGKT